MSAPSLAPSALMDTIQDLTDESQNRMLDASNRLNAVTLTLAIQEGYRMACADNGLTPPQFDDPKKFWGVA